VRSGFARAAQQNNMTVGLAKLTNEALLARLDEVAKLRIEVFRGWPHLYKANLAYERQYLPRYAETKTGTVIIAETVDRIVGVATGMGLDEEDDFVQEPFVKAGLDLKSIFYFGESVLLPDYRQIGLGTQFIAMREAAAKAHGYAMTAFCALERPVDYVPLDGFWTRRGYEKRTDLTAAFSWRDIGERKDSEKPVGFWFKTL
jgi:GNAT superfamily N-acetyltransferase